MKGPHMAWYIHTNGGGKFIYGSPLADVTVEDVAHHLSNNCRFSGATRFHYSVAQHSILVADLVKSWGADEETELKALGHDAHEYVMGDLATPFQRWFEEEFCEGADMIEQAKTRLDNVILPKIGIDPNWDEGTRRLIKRADKIAFHVESYQLFDETPEWWTELVYNNGFTVDDIPLDIRLERMLPEAAKIAFLERYGELTNGVDTSGLTKRCA